jgi:hypothetical protein
MSEDFGRFGQRYKNEKEDLEGNLKPTEEQIQDKWKKIMGEKGGSSDEEIKLEEPTK